MEVFKIIDKAIVKNIDLQKFNFSHLNYMYDYNTGIFYKETETKIDVLSYGFNYDYRDNDPISISHENFVPWITFKNVEKILNFVLYNLYETKQITNAHNFYVNNQKTLFIDEPMINEDAFIYELYKDKQYLEQNILKSTESAEILIKNHFFSFFENFSTLQDINDKIIEKYEWQQWNKFFFKDNYFKVIIILKLCNNDIKYNEFTAMYKTRIYDGIKNGRSDVIPYYENLIKLMDYLENDNHKELN